MLRRVHASKELSVSAFVSVGTAMLVMCGNGDAVGGKPASERASSRANGHEDVVIALEQRCGQILFGFVRRLGVDDAAAADVVQESLLRLFDALRAGSPIRDVRAWTFHVAYRLAMDEHRRFARGQRAATITRGTPSENDPADDLERRQVWSEVDRLPERQRAVLYLRFRADLPFEDIGSTLGITASAARSHCTQALAALRGRLGKGSG